MSSVEKHKRNFPKKNKNLNLVALNSPSSSIRYASFFDPGFFRPGIGLSPAFGCSTERDRDLGSLLGKRALNIFGDNHGFGGPEDFFGESKTFFDEFSVSTFFDVASGDSDELPLLSFFKFSEVVAASEGDFLVDVSRRIGILDPVIKIVFQHKHGN